MEEGRGCLLGVEEGCWGGGGLVVVVGVVVGCGRWRWVGGGGGGRLWELEGWWRRWWVSGRLVEEVVMG